MLQSLTHFVMIAAKRWPFFCVVNQNTETSKISPSYTHHFHVVLDQAADIRSQLSTSRSHCRTRRYIKVTIVVVKSPGL